MIMMTPPTMAKMPTMRGMTFMFRPPGSLSISRPPPTVVGAATGVVTLEGSRSGGTRPPAVRRADQMRPGPTTLRSTRGSNERKPRLAPIGTMARTNNQT